MEDRFTIVQRIKSCYVGEDCIQVMVPYEESCVIFNTSDTQYLDHKDNSFINNYIEDERRKQFPYHNIPNHHRNKKVNFANQIYEFDKPYLEMRLGGVFESYAVKDGDKALLLTKQLIIENPQKFIATREETEELLKCNNENNKKNYLIFTNGNVTKGINMLPERELVDKVVSGINIKDNYFLVELDGTNIKLKMAYVEFKGHHDEYEIELYDIPVRKYTFEEIKYLAKDITDAQEPKINTRFNKGIAKETIEEQKRLVLSKSTSKK